MDGNFLGLGLKNLLGVSLFVILFIVLMKVVFTKHPVKGVSDVIQAV